MSPIQTTEEILILNLRKVDIQTVHMLLTHAHCMHIENQSVRNTIESESTGGETLLMEQQKPGAEYLAQSTSTFSVQKVEEF